MKDFLKFTLATLTGLIISGIVLFFFSILMISSIALSDTAETTVQENSVFELNLQGNLNERSQEDPLAFLLGNDFQSYGLNDVLSSIRKAKENEHIKGIYLNAGIFNAGIASLEEIRNELLSFKESGKFIVAYADTYTQGLYYLSSVADKVLLNPKGMLEWKGLASTPMFYKDLLEKVGIEMQVFKVGIYKSAVEPYISTEMSDANREQIQVYLGSVWNQILQDVSKSRHISAEKLNSAADEMMMFHPAEKSVEYGLIDTLIYRNDVKNYLKKFAGLEDDDHLPMLDLKAMNNVKKIQPKDKSGHIIAIYYATGEIVDMSIGSPLSSGENPVINGQKVIKDLKKLKENEDIKAVVLRVNSPGGSAYASEQIWHAVTELKKEKPVIVSMGDYAASGGYYISCNADTIVAQPTTLTGSIGIFGMFPNASELTEKLGLDFDVVKTNRYADFGSMNRPMNAGEKNLMQMYVNQGYDLFLTRCSNGRAMSKEAIDKVAQGRVWTGSTALELGLVDVLGGLDTALDLAVKKSGVETYTLMSYPKQDSFMETLMNSSLSGSLKARLLGGSLGNYYRTFQMLENIDRCDRIQARLPFELNIH